MFLGGVPKGRVCVRAFKGIKVRAVYECMRLYCVSQTKLIWFNLDCNFRFLRDYIVLYATNRNATWYMLVCIKFIFYNNDTGLVQKFVSLENL